MTPAIGSDKSQAPRYGRVGGGGGVEGRSKAWSWDYSQRPTQKTLLHFHDPPATAWDLRLCFLPWPQTSCFGAQTSCLWIRVPLGTQHSESLVESSGLTEEISHSLIWGNPSLGGGCGIIIISLEVWVLGHMPEDRSGLSPPLIKMWITAESLKKENGQWTTPTSSLLLCSERWVSRSPDPKMRRGEKSRRVAGLGRAAAKQTSDTLSFVLAEKVPKFPTQGQWSKPL